MPESETAPVVVVGGGPAGYTAALYAARAGLQPVCIEGFESGGQISRSFLVENFPGVPDGTSGLDLSNRIREQAVSFGADVVLDEVLDVDLSQRPFTVRTTSHSYRAESLIIATGSRPRPLGLPGEEEMVGRGIAYCALCDGAFFAGMDVVVVGGGNAALGEAVAMARVASQVTLVHRRDTFRADDVVVRAARTMPGITVRTPLEVAELVPNDTGDLRAVRLRDVVTGETTLHETAGLFIAIGHEPAVGPFAEYVAMKDGHILTAPGSTATSVEGVFAAGDVADSRYRQAITAASSGSMAAIDAERWLMSGEWSGPLHQVLPLSA